MVHFVRMFVLTAMTSYLFTAMLGAQPPRATIFFAVIITSVPAFLAVKVLFGLEKRYPASRYYIPILGLLPLALFGGVALFVARSGFGNDYTVNGIYAGIVWGALWFVTSIIHQPQPQPVPNPIWGRGSEEEE